MTLLFLIAAAVLCARAEDLPELSGFLRDQWTQEDGLPINHLNDLAIGPDGMLWVSTYDGLVRFDGVRFETLRTNHPLGPPTNRIIHLVPEPDGGAMWILCEEGELQRRTATDVVRVPSVRRDALPEPGARVFWALPLGADPLPASQPSTLHRDDFTGGVNVYHPLNNDNGWIQLGRLESVDGEQVTVVPEAAIQWSVAAREFRYVSGVPQLDPDAEYRSGYPSLSFPKPLIDGDVKWMRSDGQGLLRFRPRLFDTPSAHVGGEQNIFRMLWHAEQGLVWALYQSHGWRPFADPEDIPALLEREHMAGLGVYPVGFTDKDGVTWRGVRKGVFRLENGAWEKASGLSGVRRTWQTRDGTRWMSGGHVLRLDEAGWAPVQSADGAPLSFYARAAAELPDGAQLLGDRSLLYLPAGSLTARPVENELGAIRDLRLDDAGRLWISTEEHGLCTARMDGDALGPLRCAGEGNGLDRAMIHFSVPDRHGRVWLGSNQGVGVVHARILAAFAEGEREDVPALWLDTRDGMPTAEVNNFIGDGVVVDDDGRLWLATQEGAARIDPARFTFPDPPRTVLLGLTVGGEHRALSEELTLPSEHPPVRLRWTNDARQWAEQSVFRYRLSDDQPWSLPATSRALELATLPAGVSVLQIQSRLGGDWGPTATLRVYREPALHERGIFSFLLALALAGVVVAVMGVRSVFLKRQAEQLQRQVAAQTRQLSDQNTQLNQRNAQLARQSAELQERSRQIAAQAERLRELDRLKRQLIANVSHELRTPLALILAPLSGLQSEVPTGSRLARDLGIALRSARRLEQLIGQLFDLARAQAGGLQLRARRIDLAAFVDDLVGRFQPHALAGKHRLRFTGSGAVPLWADPDLLDKVLGNFLTNALRHSPPESTITVGMQQDGEHARVWVEDEGAGVPVEHREQVFDRFFQVDGASDRQRDGAGLGLALARELVELHGGQIGVEDGTVGARFWCTLPLGVAHVSPDDVFASTDAEQPAAAPPQPVAEAPAEGGARPRVLLVEDHPDMRAYLAENLSGRFAVTAAEDGHTALAHLRAGERFALIISDVMMPGMDGHALVRQIRAMPTLVGVPVMFVSARQELADRLEGLSLADDYLAKPFQMPELLARASALLRRGGPAAVLEEVPPPEPQLSRLEARLIAVADPRLSDKGFRVAALAKAMAMSTRTLQVRMQDSDLPPPGEWLRDRRMAVAGALLRSGEHESVSAVADAVGLNHSYFSRTYRAYTGRSPRDDLSAGLSS